jgi:hypothetical protein
MAPPLGLTLASMISDAIIVCFILLIPSALVVVVLLVATFPNPRLARATAALLPAVHDEL